MDHIVSIDTQAHSVTATICEQAQVYGATPERGELDPRVVWDEDDAMEAAGEAFRILAEGVGPDGTQLGDERECLLWGFVRGTTKIGFSDSFTESHGERVGL